MQLDPAAGPQGQTAPLPGERVVSDEDKKLAKAWQDKITAAQKRVSAKFKTFEAGRKLLAGGATEESDNPNQQRVRANLHYANMAAMLPQIYAKDPEFSVQPTRAVPPAQMKATKTFAATAEFMLQKVVVKDANLKKQAKNVIRSAFATSVGWIKASWQEDRNTDPLIDNRLKDSQDNVANIEQLAKSMDDPAAASEQELKAAQLKQAVAGLASQAEIKVARGLALDFVMSEDVLVLDNSIRAIGDYTRAGALAHGVWMTPDQYEKAFKYKCKKGRSYTEQNGAIAANGTDQSANQSSLLRVWEIWCQDDNRIYTVCEGEEGFCKPPESPDWTGKRWYPFFLVAFNVIDGSLYPLSDIELTHKLVCEYNETREDFVRDRKESLPLNVVRKGGSLTDDDLNKLKNRRGGDIIAVEGIPGKPLSEDMFSGQLSQIKGENYDTSQSRSDIERILGGSDATTGSITKAKTATEAEILSQGLRSRSGERQDILEDVLNELGPYCLEIMLRRYTPQEVQAIAGPDAAWPTMDIEGIFQLVSVEVRGGSTGKPDRLQEQDRWTKLLPIINEAVAKVAELREKGQDALAQAVIELTRETLRRFDERIDIEQFLPKKPEGEDDPAMLKQQLVAGKQQLEHVMGQYQDAQDKLDKGLVSAAASIATSQNPINATIAFKGVMGEIAPGVLMSLATPIDIPGPGEQPLPLGPGHEEMPGQIEPAGQPEAMEDFQQETAEQPQMP